MRKILCLLAVTAVAGTAPLAAQDMDPVGKFEFTTAVQGQPVTGTIDITRSDEGVVRASVTADGQGTFQMSSVEVSGNIITLIGTVPEAGELFIELQFDDDEFTGSWTLGFDGGELSGRRATR